MSNIILMCGIQGSGKSTWAKQHLKGNQNTVVISRDEIRRELVKNDSYFSKENEVWDTFVQTINEAIDNNIGDIIIDATHISVKSRQKILNKLIKNANIKKYNLKVVVMETSLETCLFRNSLRVGFDFVPEDVVKSFYENFEMPIEEEFSLFNNKFNDIIIVSVQEKR